MASFDKSYDYLHTLEGIGKNLGYVNVETDKGGETVGGRTRKWKAIRGKMPTDLEIWAHVDLQKDQPNFPANLESHPTLPGLIKKAYQEDEWKDIWGDNISVQEVADEMLEFAVHKTARMSVQILQYCMNKLNYNGKLFPDMSQRGFMGPITLQGLTVLSQRPGDIETLLKMFNCEQGHFYIERFDQSPDQEANARGFFRRVEIRKNPST